MKMMLCALVSLSMIFASIQSYSQAFACGLDKGNITGGACSVKDIKKLENQRMQGNTDFSGIVKEGKTLRPVKITPEVKNPEQTQCIFCLQEGLFEKIKH